MSLRIFRFIFALGVSFLISANVFSAYASDDIKQFEVQYAKLIKNKRTSIDDFGLFAEGLRSSMHENAVIALGIDPGRKLSSDEKKKERDLFLLKYDLFKRIKDEVQKRYSEPLEFNNFLQISGARLAEADLDMLNKLDMPSKGAFWVRPVRSIINDLRNENVVVHRGEPLQLIDEKGDLVCVRYQNDKYGWISGIDLSSSPVQYADIIPEKYRNGIFSYILPVKDVYGKDIASLKVKYVVNNGVLQTSELIIKNLCNQNLTGLGGWSPNFQVIGSGHYENTRYSSDGGMAKSVIVMRWGDKWAIKQGGDAQLWVGIGEEKTFLLEPSLLEDVTVSNILFTEATDCVWVDFVAAALAQEGSAFVNFGRGEPIALGKLRKE